jgi:acetyltransferase-like isoleucine patch superfamily enzyme/acyl carrier protein
MDHANQTTEEQAERERRRVRLDPGSFIRARLFGDERSAFARYVDLAFHSFSWPKLIRYELLTFFVGPLPGAPGLVLRKWLYPYLFRSTGRGVIFGPSLTLRHADRITLGDQVVIDRDCILDARGAGERGVIIGDRVIVGAGAAIQSKVGHIEIGADCNIGSGAHIVAQGPVIIGDNVSVAGNAMIAGGRYVVEHDGGEAAPRFTSGPIRIGRNAKIGMGAIVQDGVTVGENAIVAPGAVVFEDVPPSTVVWGNPARPLRQRHGGTMPADGPADGPAAGPAASTGGPGDDEELRRRVRDYLRNDLFVEFGPEDFGDADSLVDAGILDSLALVRLALWIEQSFGVEVDLGTIGAAELGSVERIAGWIGRRIAA